MKYESCFFLIDTISLNTYSALNYFLRHDFMLHFKKYLIMRRAVYCRTFDDLEKKSIQCSIIEFTDGSNATEKIGIDLERHILRQFYTDFTGRIKYLLEGVDVEIVFSKLYNGCTRVDISVTMQWHNGILKTVFAKLLQPIFMNYIAKGLASVRMSFVNQG